MAISAELLAALGQGNVDSPVLDPVDFEGADDPIISAILNDTNISPGRKAGVSARQRELIRNQKLQMELGDLEAKAQDRQEGLISWLGPIPLGFQFGTALDVAGGLGVEGETAKFWVNTVVDAVVDPLNLFLGLGITKLGRAARFLNGLSPAKKAERMIDGAKALAQVSTDKSTSTRLIKAMEERDMKEVTKIFKEGRRKKLTPQQEKILEQQDPDLLKLIRGERQAIKDMKSAFQLEEDEIIDKLHDGFLDRVIAGQSSFFNVTNQLTGKEIYVPKNLNEGLAKSLKATGVAGTLEKAGSKVKNAVVANFARGAGKLLAKSADPTNAETAISSTINTAIDLISPNSPISRTGADRLLESGEHFSRVAGSQVAGIHNFSQNIVNESEVIFKGDLAKRVGDDLIGGDPAKAALNLNEGQQASLTQLQSFNESIGRLADEAEITPRQYVNNFVRASVTPTPSATIGETVKRAVKTKRDIIDEHLNDFLKDVNRTYKNIPASQRPYFILRRLGDFIKQRGLENQLTISRKVGDITSNYYESVGTAMVQRQVEDALGLLNSSDNLPLAVRIKGGKVNKGQDDIKRALLKQNKNVYKESSNRAFKGTKFHADIADEVEAIFGRDFFVTKKMEHPKLLKFLSAVDRVNALGKASMLSIFPFFHATSVAVMSVFAGLPVAQAAEASGAAFRGGAAIAKTGLKQLFSGKVLDLQEEIFRLNNTAIRASEDGVRETFVLGNDLRQEYLLSGSRVGRVKEDSGHDVLANSLSNVANTIRESELIPDALRGIAGRPVERLKDVNDLSDKFLWVGVKDQAGFVLWGHLREKLIRDAVKKEGVEVLQNPKRIFDINTEAMTMTNSTVGGLIDRLTIHPNWKRLARLTLLAPDWTLANLRMATDLLLNAPGFRNNTIGRVLGREDVIGDARFNFALGYQMRAGFYWWTLGNLMNYGFTSVKDGKGRWLWENDKEAIDKSTGLKSRVELPYTREDGRRQFLDIGKQFAEPVDWLYSGIQTFQKKLAPLPRTIISQITGRDSLGREIYGTEDGPLQAATKRIWHTTSQFAPIPLRGAITAAVTPASQASNIIRTFGFGVSSESREGFQTRQRVQKIKNELALGNEIPDGF